MNTGPQNVSGGGARTSTLGRGLRRGGLELGTPDHTEAIVVEEHQRSLTA